MLEALLCITLQASVGPPLGAPACWAAPASRAGPLGSVPLGVPDWGPARFFKLICCEPEVAARPPTAPRVPAGALCASVEGTAASRGPRALTSGAQYGPFHIDLDMLALIIPPP
jgi:hypothetical protein